MKEVGGVSSSVSASGPLRTSTVRFRETARAKARAGSRQRLDEAVDACGADCPALLGLVARRITRCARCARSAQTDAASQLWRRAARAATRPAVLGASYARCRPPARSFAGATPACPGHATTAARRDRGSPAGAISGSASSAGPGEARTQCAHPQLTRGICLSGVNAVNAASYAARARAEQRSEVGAQRRPTQHEPLPGTPWRDALDRRTQCQSGRARTTATGRKRNFAHRERGLPAIARAPIRHTAKPQPEERTRC